jgi:hypothetical protein
VEDERLTGRGESVRDQLTGSFQGILGIGSSTGSHILGLVNQRGTAILSTIDVAAGGVAEALGNRLVSLCTWSKYCHLLEMERGTYQVE